MVAVKKHPDTILPFILSGGDPAGISPDISIDAILFYIYKATNKETLIYFHTSDPQDLQKLKKSLENRLLFWQIFDSFEKLRLFYKSDQYRSIDSKCKLLVLDLHQIYKHQFPGETLNKGDPNLLSGFLAWKALDLCCAWIEEFNTSGLLTAPLSKKWTDIAIKNENKNSSSDPKIVFSGHTGYLANRFQSDVIMLMHGKKFSVLPLTTHISIKNVPDELEAVVFSPGLKRCIKLLSKMKVFQNSKWALCALNPHGGEDGLMGNEESTYLKKWCKNQIKSIEGPLPSDTLFTKEILKKYRLVLSCYHDQGLIPFKALEAENGINCTIGLPFFRCSPDHGTAYNIAGSGLASTTSMIRCMEVLLKQELI